MNTCAECRFWDRNTPDFVRQGAGGDWSQCRRASLSPTSGSGAWINAPRGGEPTLMTRSDFGCVQFEPLPVPETMPVIYAGPGESVQPLPGHSFTAPDWLNTITTALKVSIDGQWFEIRPKG